MQQRNAMASYRPLEDHSPQVERFKRAYGGSTRQAPFFRTPESVRYNSLGKAKDLGTQRELRTTLYGSLGGIHGANSHFFRIALTEPGRLGARLIDASQCAIDWLCLHFLDDSRESLQHGASGYVNSPEGQVSPGDNIGNQLVPVAIDVYVLDGYWQDGYAPDLVTLQDSMGNLSQLSYGDYLSQQAVNASITAGSLEELAARAILAEPLPSGTYFILLTTQRWQATPYELQIVLAPLSTPISGTATLQFEPTADTGVRQLAGNTTLQLSPAARIKEFLDASGDTAMQFAPRAGMAVTSPVS